MRSLFLILLIIVLAVGLIFGGCTKPAPTTPETTPPATSPTPTATTLTPKYGGTLRIISGGGSSSIGWPADVSHVAGSQECLETLLRQDAEGKIVPWLAESYQLTDDLKSITFNIRKGVKFHDDSDFNAEVVKWNLDNIINVKFNPSWSSVDIIDDYTIRVNLAEWMNTIPTTFGDTQTPAHMISKAAFDKNGLDWVRQNPIGTGPFKLVSYTPDVGMKVVRNPDYWVKEKPYLDGIEYISIIDPMTQKMTMQTGGADMTGAIDPGRPAVDYTNMGLIVKMIMDSTHVLVPDTTHPDSPWANPKVREAVEYAIDREAMAKAFGYGYWQAPYQIPPRGSLAYDPNFTLGRKYDQEKAKQLLAEAGYPDGFKTTIIVAPMGLSVNREPIIAVQADLAKVGIQVNLDFPEFSKFSTYMGPGTWTEGDALAVPVPMIGQYFRGGLKFIFDFIGQSWLRTPELTQAYKASFASPAQDVKLIRVVTGMMTKDALIIPICEAGLARAQRPYVISNYGERGHAVFWNTEDAWLNK